MTPNRRKVLRRWRRALADAEANGFGEAFDVFAALLAAACAGEAEIEPLRARARADAERAPGGAHFDVEAAPPLLERAGRLLPGSTPPLLGAAPRTNAAWAALLDGLFEGLTFTPCEGAVDAVGPDALGEALEILGQDRAGRRHAGAWHTPPALARWICRTALADWAAARLFGADRAGRARVARFLDGEDALSHAERGRLAEALRGRRVCDPAAGAGAFLLAALDVLTSALARCTGTAPHAAALGVAAHQIFGADADPRAAAVCRFRLAMRAAPPGAEREALLERLATHVATGDSLFDGAAERAAPFDLVLGNPPYVSFGLRGRGANDAERQRRTRERFPGSAEYKISVYALFYELALELAARGGVVAFLTPDSFLLGRYFSKVRRTLLEGAAVRRLVLVQRDFWRGGTIGRPTIGFFEREGISGDVEAVTAPDLQALLEGGARTHRMRQAVFERTPHARFRLAFAPVAEAFIEAMERAPGRLGDVARITTGLRSRTRQRDLIAEAQRGAAWRRGIVSGRQVSPQGVRWEGHWLHVDPAHVYAGGWDPEIVERPKLLIRQTGDALVAGIDREGLYHLNNAHAAAPRAPGVSLAYLAALLNSRLMNRFYRLIALETGRSMAQTDIETLLLLPYAEPPEAARREAERFAGEGRCEEILADAYGLDDAMREYLRGDALYPALQCPARRA